MRVHATAAIIGLATTNAAFTCNNVKEVYQQYSCCTADDEYEIGTECSLHGLSGNLKESIETYFKANLNTTVAYADGAVTGHYGVTGSILVKNEQIDFAVGTNPYSGHPLTVESMQYFYSSTKLMAHTLLAKYWEQNVVQLDEPLCTYLDVFCSNATTKTPTVFNVIRPILPTSTVENGQYVEDGVSYPIIQKEIVVDLMNTQTKNYSYALVPAKRPPSVRDAMTHSTGLSYTFWTAYIRGYGISGFTDDYAKHMIYNSYVYDAAVSLGMNGPGKIPGYPEYLTMIDSTKELTATDIFRPHVTGGVLVQQPGSMVDYGMGSDIVGALCEAAYAKAHPDAPLRLQDVMRKDLWEPLGMHHTFFYIDPNRTDFESLKQYTETHIAPRSAFNASSPLGWSVSASDETSFYITPVGESGGGGSISNVQDYTKLVHMIHNKGMLPDGTRFLRKSTIEYLYIPQMDILVASSEFKHGPSLANEGMNGLTWGIVGKVITPETLSPRYYRGDSSNKVYTYRREYETPNSLGPITGYILGQSTESENQVNMQQGMSWGGAAGTSWLIAPTRGYAVNIATFQSFDNAAPLMNKIVNMIEDHLS